MTFGKLEDGRLHLCPTFGADGQGRLHTNLPKYYEKAADRDGWLEVVYTDAPSDGEYRPVYTEQDGRIVQSWQPVEPQPEPVDPVAERFEFLEDCLLEMSEVVYGED